MPDLFVKTFHVGWGDLDSNSHMANTAYLDKAVDVRMMYFAGHGFSMREFDRQRFGPVVQRDTIEYFRELRLLDPVTVSFALVGMSEDGSRFHIRNEFFRKDDQLAARLDTLGGWMSLETRRLISPPAAMIEAFWLLVRTEDFQILDSSLR
jgi:acyl-CoA thioester hydrolase